MKTWMLFICLFVNAAWAEPGNVVVVAQSLNGSAFTEVESNAPIVMQIVQGEEHAVWLQAPPALHSALRLKQVGQRLKVVWQPDKRLEALANNSDVKVKIAMPNLELLEIQGPGNLYLAEMTLSRLHVINRGSGDVYSADLNVDALELSLQGSGDIKGQTWQLDSLEINNAGSADIEIGRLVADRLSTNSAGSGDIELYEPSTVRMLNLRVLGSGDFDALPLVVDEAVIALLGSSDVTLTVEGHLDANILGSGDVRYAGTPEVNARQLGSGSIMPLEEGESL